MFQAFTWSCFFARKLIPRELYVNYLMRKQTITFFTKAHFWFFLFQNHASKLGVRLIHECGLYTSFYSTYGRHSLRFLGPQLWSKLSKEERNIGTLATFRTTIRKKDVTSFLEGCGSECRLCLG